jgi:hypothetical protein
MLSHFNRQTWFLYGSMDQLKKGSTIEVKHIRLSEGIRKTSSSKININGRSAIFKTINKKPDETQSDFKLVAPDTTVEQAFAKAF